ncbi:MAG TPA: hypothetical protein VHU19_04410 [Pyrinomonadaceae bacterium]|jgi:hypothetical protein|nr:hypothetical protein [Pyrinomonadaceae bacterium]
MSFRLTAVVFCFLLFGSVADAAPCALVKSKPDAWVESKVDALVSAARAAYDRDEAREAYQRAVGQIADTLRLCKLSEDEGFASRYREFIEYVEALSLDQQPDHELGFNVPDKQYFDETRQYVQIPEFLTTPDFLRFVSRSETLERAKSLLRQLNSKREPSEQLLFFSYKSRHLGTPDNDDSLVRFLVVVPGDAGRGVPEKWVQFGVTDPRARIRTRNVSVVSALRQPDGGASNVYFKDFYRTYRRDGSISSIRGRWELGYGDDNCAQCHKSGVLPVFPVAGSVSAGEQATLRAVNERFLTYGSPRFGNYLDAERFGPGLGVASRSDRERRFGAGFGESVVARAMTCATCHRREGLGSFNWPMDQTIISSFVEGGQMPYGSKLRDAERRELYEKLIQEYFATDPARPGILKSWLLGRLRQSG